MRFLSVAMYSASLIGSLLFLAPRHLLAQARPAPASDFTIAVQAGLQSIALHPETQSQQQEIVGQEYKSTWDEFGMNILADGNAKPDEIKNQILDDIIQSIDTAGRYNQEEANYLQETNLTPEQIKAAESSVGVDIAPDETIDPNPSADSNPDALTTPADTALEDGETVSAQKAASALESQISAPEQAAATTTDMTSGTINDGQIFNAILNAEQLPSANQDTSTSQPSETPPSAPEL